MYSGRSQKFIASIKRNFVFIRFYEICSLSISWAFFGAGSVKLLGLRFAGPDAGSIYQFFESLYSASYFWRYIGGMQVLSALLLIIPFTRLAGVLCALPITTCIFAITASLFDGLTPFITLMLLLSNLFMLVWNIDRIALLFASQTRVQRFVEVDHKLFTSERIGFVLLAIAGAIGFLLLRWPADAKYLNALMASTYILFISGMISVVFGAIQTLRIKRTTQI